MIFALKFVHSAGRDNACGAKVLGCSTSMNQSARFLKFCSPGFPEIETGAETLLIIFSQNGADVGSRAFFAVQQERVADHFHASELAQFSQSPVGKNVD